MEATEAGGCKTGGSWAGVCVRSPGGYGSADLLPRSGGNTAGSCLCPGLAIPLSLHRLSGPVPGPDHGALWPGRWHSLPIGVGCVGPWAFSCLGLGLRDLEMPVLTWRLMSWPWRFPDRGQGQGRVPFQPRVWPQVSKAGD